MKARWIIAILAVMLVLNACGSKKHEAMSHAPNGDLRMKTASADELPSFLNGQPEQVRLVYTAAGKATDLLNWIPCYCGCGESAGHESNLNCFIHKVNEDGSVVWDDHGTRCGICLQIAAMSIQMKADGKSNKAIRDMIDSAYKKGYAAATHTPMPT